MTSRSFRIITTSLALVILSQATIDIYLPSMPEMAVALGSSRSMVQRTLSTYFLGFAFCQLFFGPLSDRFGRRPILVTGLSLLLIGSLVCAWAGSIEVILGMRFLQGTGGGICCLTSRTLMRDLASGVELQRRSSLMDLCWATVPIVAPVFGSVLQHLFGWRGSFYFLALTTATLLALLPTWLPESQDSNHRSPLKPREVIQRYISILTDRQFVGHMIPVACIYGFLAAFQGVTPFLFQVRLGLTPIQYGFCALTIALGYLGGSVVNNRTIHLLAPRQRMRVGLSGLFFFGLLLCCTSVRGNASLATLLALMTGFYFSIPLLFSCCMASAMTPFSRWAGCASALFGFCSFTGAGMTTLSIAHLPSTPAILGLTLLVLTGMMTLSLRLIAPNPLSVRS